MIKLFNLIDGTSELENNLTKEYSIGQRNIQIINTSKKLQDAMSTIKYTPYIGFDSEQRPTFKKGQKPHGLALIQLATKTTCYLIQVKQIDDLSPLIQLLENENIIKIGTGLKGDSASLFKEFNLILRSTLDLETVFKKLSSKNQIGAKRAALIILNENLQKSKNMSRSNWENKDLTDGQIKYATEDATVVYDVLNQMLEHYPFTKEIMPPFLKSKI